MIKVNCKQWSECGVEGGGCCAKELFGGRPSGGVCSACPHREMIDPDSPAVAPLRSELRLGDKLKAIADATGITALVKAYEKVTGKPCGCDKRQFRIN